MHESKKSAQEPESAFQTLSSTAIDLDSKVLNWCISWLLLEDLLCHVVVGSPNCSFCPTEKNYCHHALHTWTIFRSTDYWILWQSISWLNKFFPPLCRWELCNANESGEKEIVLNCTVSSYFWQWTKAKPKVRTVTLVAYDFFSLYQFIPNYSPFDSTGSRVYVDLFFMAANTSFLSKKCKVNWNKFSVSQWKIASKILKLLFFFIDLFLILSFGIMV